MAEIHGQEKTEQPTSKRIEESRANGQVAKSLEINSLAVFTTGLLLLFLLKGYLGGKISEAAVFIFNSLDVLDMNIDLRLSSGYYSNNLLYL